MYDDRKWLVIGVSGVTCGGKTTLSNALELYLQQIAGHIGTRLHDRMRIGRTHVIHQDEYFLDEDDPRHQLVAELGHNNWELPTALDGDRMLNDIHHCLGGAGNLFRPDAPPATLDVLLIEGFVIFNEPDVLELCHLKYHLHLPFEKCFERRQRREYTPPDVVGYFERCVWPMYLRNFEEYKDRSDVVVLNGELSSKRTCDYVIASIRQYLATAAFGRD